ncbi:RNA-dependent RNA polymerase 1-like [Stegodyphus dumicola]|uniref:RNA-dependent RNA polymerase 1-like n=1 Tax=Stegodyphus dumicola TaxID=202533 RepID=UPI0015B0B580|nr:RNA-dependent RNA polymerase 1-like [Stegodyphus dumicola]
MDELNFRVVIVPLKFQNVEPDSYLQETKRKLEACGLVVNNVNFVNLKRPEDEDYPEIEELTIQVQAMFPNNFKFQKAGLYRDVCKKWKNQHLPNYCPILALHENDSFVNKRIPSHRSVQCSDISFGVLPHNGTYLQYASLSSSSCEIDFYHDIRNLEIQYSHYKISMTYNNIRKIFINIGSSPCEIFFDLCNPPVVFRVEHRRNSTYEAYTLNHRTCYLPSPERIKNTDLFMFFSPSTGNKIDTDILGRSNVLKVSLNDPNLAEEIVSRIHFRCSEKPIHYMNVTSVKKMKPIDPVFEFCHFGCTYILTAIIKRNFTVVEQASNVNEEIEQLKTLCNKDGDCLEKALINVLRAVDSGKIINFWCEAEKQFNHYLNSKDEINYKHYVVPLKCRMIRRITLTPTRQLLWPPEIMYENRVLRNFDSEYAIRVSFRDDNMMRLSFYAAFADSDIFNNSIEKPMLEGICIGFRLYEFLAWSNSQIRDHGVWLYARDKKGNTVSDIRRWMGEFSHIHSVSKYMARMGQCFSQTEDAISVPLDPSHIRTEDDIEGGYDVTNEKPYCFSDGIGKISVKLANEVHKALGHDKHCSAFQIRYGGYKGMLLTDPALKDTDIVFRKSMKKFNSPGNIRLEIAGTSAPIKLQLNRNIITILNDLGIRHRTFLKLQEKMVNALMEMLFEEEKAAAFLMSETPSALFPYKDLTGSGIYLTTEPFFRSLLLALHRHYGEKLKSKANISIDPSDGRNMYGVLDETGTLNYGEVFIQYTKDVSKGETTQDTEIRKGEVVVTKNPCHLPGDIRKFIAVDVPQLHHIVDCIVFPSRGPRPHPNEMAGSDLDGDEYAVMWSPDLIFHRSNAEPGNFRSTPEAAVSTIRVEDMIEFLGTYIKNDQVGTIANAHLAHADYGNIFSNICIKIANKVHIAVDFAKHGESTHLDPSERPVRFPDFMEKYHKDTYKSTKALGKMYRICKDLESENENASIDYHGIQVDPYLIYPGWEKYKEDALKSRNKYNALLRAVLRNYGIQHEAEAFSGAFTKLHCRFQERKDRAEVEKVIIGCIKRLSKSMLEEFLDEFKDTTDINSAQEYILQKASAWYIVTYSDSGTKFLSFPWTVSTYLSNIKIKNSSFNPLPVSPLIANMDEQIKLCEAENILPHPIETDIWLEYEFLCDPVTVKLASRVLILWAQDEQIIDRSGYSHTGFLYPNTLIRLFLHVAELAHYVFKKGKQTSSTEKKVFSPASLVLEFLRFCTTLRFYNKNEISSVIPFSVYKYSKLAKSAVVAYHRFALSGEFHCLNVERNNIEEKMEMNPIQIESKIFPKVPIDAQTLQKAQDALIKYSGVEDVTMREIRQTKKVCVTAYGSELSIKILKGILRKHAVLRTLFIDGRMPDE